jgi:hypothetical protein
VRIVRITAKLGNMRKPAEWVVYPVRTNQPAEDTNLLIQSDTRIASFDPATGKGMLSKAKPNGAYFLHLTKFMGATEITVPADVIAAAIAAQPKSGDEIGPGVTIA